MACGTIVASIALLAASPGAPRQEPRASGCAAYHQVHQRTYSRAAERRALRDRFQILGRPVRLAPPVDWTRDPYRSRTWRARLHGWVWIDVLLHTYAERGDVRALKRARDLALDWVRRNPPSRDLRWEGKIAGDRAGYLSYLARAAGCQGILSRRQSSTLRRSVRRHARLLSRTTNYSSTNHGLFMDAGLALIDRYLPAAELARGQRRFERSLRRSVNFREAVHLEHSPAYHLLIITLIERVVAFADGSDPGLVDLLQRMKDAAGWFVMPDGTVTELGDTARAVAPDYARRSAESKRGISPTRESGYAIVREPGSYLSVAAGYHGRAHKQADELTFELFEHGQRVIQDTGRYGHGRDQRHFLKAAAQRYTLSSRAHSVLVADGRSFQLSGPYGTGIAATGTGAGWYAIEGTNPLLARRGIHHRRLFLYRPGSALVVVDRAASGRPHTYTRYFQLAPGVRVADRGRTLELAAGDFAGSLHDTPTAHSRGRIAVRGLRRPLLGWYSPGGWSAFIPRWAVGYRSRGRSVTHATTIGLAGPRPLEATVPRITARRTDVILTGGDLPDQTLTVTRHGPRLTIEQLGGER